MIEIHHVVDYLFLLWFFYIFEQVYFVGELLLYDTVTFEIQSSSMFFSLVDRCIDSWFKVNRSCPEHPVDWWCRHLKGIYLTNTEEAYRLLPAKQHIPTSWGGDEQCTDPIVTRKINDPHTYRMDYQMDNFRNSIVRLTNDLQRILSNLRRVSGNGKCNFAAHRTSKVKKANHDLICPFLNIFMW